MISFERVGGNDIYAINLVRWVDSRTKRAASHYEIHDTFRRKCIAVCESLEEANKKIESFFKGK